MIIVRSFVVLEERIVVERLKFERNNIKRREPSN